MKALTLEQTIEVHGGILPAIIAAITIFTLPKIIHDHTKVYNQWGQQIGEYTYETLHPYDPNA